MSTVSYPLFFLSIKCLCRFIESEKIHSNESWVDPNSARKHAMRLPLKQSKSRVRPKTEAKFQRQNTDFDELLKDINDDEDIDINQNAHDHKSTFSSF